MSKFHNRHRTPTLISLHAYLFKFAVEIAPEITRKKRKKYYQKRIIQYNNWLALNTRKTAHNVPHTIQYIVNDYNENKYKCNKKYNWMEN